MKLLATVFVLAVYALQEASSLKLTVYYESLCPDSIRFITRQLYPTYQKLAFDVEFIPYGKADHRTNPWSIRCQHGANECYGNAVQACLLARVKNQADQLNFVNCVMSTSYPPINGKDCATQNNLNYEGVESCSTGSEGQKLLATLGDKTHSISPPLSFVPTITLNDKFDQSIQNLALSDLPTAICSTDPSVKGCSNIRRRG